MYMIKFLFKVIHYEPSSEHKDNVMRSFYFIWALLSTLPVGLIYLVYKRTPERNATLELLFFASEILVVGLIYYLIVMRKSKVFIESDLGRHYFTLGRFTNIFKPLIPVIMFGVVVMLGRMIFILFD